ncbi:MAG: CAP domain-containing protein [Roseibacillus sp.]
MPLTVQAGGLEERVTARINQYRARHGRAPFARHGGLDRLAERHSEEMARSRKMSHHGFSERAQRQRAASGWCGPRSSRDEGSRFSDPNPGFQNVLF